MLSDQLSDYMDTVTDYLPALAHLSPITLVGGSIVVVCALLYFYTRVPEYLLVVITALLYAVAPMLH